MFHTWPHFHFTPSRDSALAKDREVHAIFNDNDRVAGQMFSDDGAKPIPHWRCDAPRMKEHQHIARLQVHDAQALNEFWLRHASAFKIAVEE